LKRMKDIPNFDRPREKLVAKGPKALSDTELLAVLLGKGVKGKDVFQIAHSVLRKLDSRKGKLDVNTLCSIEGVGLAKACRIMAAFEFARRRASRENVVVEAAEDILPLVLDIVDKKQEYLVCITLNGANEVIEKRVITVGLLNKNQIHPREVFADAISDRAASVILAHNHPSGVVEPSSDDIVSTKQLADSGKMIGIEVLDHVIVTRNGYLSLKETGFF
jgi:DNA repair protein RadC